MDKTQFLAALAAKDFVSYVGLPELRETKPDGTKWYAVNIRETKGTECTYRNVDFYVVQEGTLNEVAYYKEEPPSQMVRNRALFDWMMSVIDAAPESYKAIQIHWVSERYEMVVFSMLEIDVSDTLEWKTYYIRKGFGAKRLIVNHEPWRLTSILNR